MLVFSTLPNHTQIPYRPEPAGNQTVEECPTLLSSVVDRYVSVHYFCKLLTHLCLLVPERDTTLDPVGLLHPFPKKYAMEHLSTDVMVY